MRTQKWMIVLLLFVGLMPAGWAVSAALDEPAGFHASVVAEGLGVAPYGTWRFAITATFISPQRAISREMERAPVSLPFTSVAP